MAVIDKQWMYYNLLRKFNPERASEPTIENRIKKVDEIYAKVLTNFEVEICFTFPDKTGLFPVSSAVV